MLENPYQSPEAPIIPESLQDTGVTLSTTSLQFLKEASPWLRFCGIIGYIAAVFIVFVGLLAIAGVSSIGGEFGDFAWLFGFFYIPAGVLYFLPAHFTYNFGKRIRQYQLTNSNEDLEQAFKNNKLIWKFNGIMYIIALSFIPLIAIIAIIAGVLSVMSML